MELVDKINQIVKQSEAYDNELFRTCGSNKFKTSRYLCKSILQEWYPITESFCINSLVYCSLIAKFTLDRSISNKERDLLNNYLALVLDIGAGEFEIKTKNPKNFHYTAFLRVAEKLDCNADDIISGKIKISRATIDLRNQIDKSFNSSSIEQGLAVLVVVETTAYNIVKMMKNVFSANTFGFNEYELMYIDRHLIIELEHDNQVDHMTSIIEKLDVDVDLTVRCTESLCKSFGSFWNSIYLDWKNEQK